MKCGESFCEQCGDCLYCYPDCCEEIDITDSNLNKMAPREIVIDVWVPAEPVPYPATFIEKFRHFAYAYRWMPINEMPRIGSLNCGSWCRCYLEYR